MGAFDFIKSLFGGKKEEAPQAAPKREQPAEVKAEPAPAPAPKAEAEKPEAPVLSQPISSTGGGYGKPFAEVVREAEAKEEESSLGVDIKENPGSEVTLQRAEKFLQDVFAVMGIEVQIFRRPEEDGTVYELVGERLGILIGKHGQTMDALQYLANLAANKDHADGHARIMLDIEGYRSRREETLMRLAGHLAEKACRIGQEVHLEPMNRHERKIIHTALQDNRKVTTYSAGEEPRRYVVIVPRRRRRKYESEY
jgi:spoIIIJ-associated protein